MFIIYEHGGIVNTKETDLVERAIATALSKLITNSIKLTININSELGIDGLLTVSYLDSPKIDYVIEVKKYIQSLAFLSVSNNNFNKNTILITEFLSESIIEYLLSNKIQFIDTAGNIYLENKFFLIQSTGKPRPKMLSVPQVSRAFSKKGLIVGFHFLLNEELLNRSYRFISEITGVSLGSLKWIFYHLKNEGFIVINNSNKKELINKKDFLSKWITAYQEKLRPSLIVGKYRFAKQEDRKKYLEILENQNDSLWGSEPAAEVIDGYLKSKVFTIYSDQSESSLVKGFKLINDPNGDIEIVRKFWKSEFLPVAKSTKTVPLILIYADLIISGYSRNLEVAERLREKYDLFN